MDETYNGWTNYPTWAVNLWLSNDQGLYNETLDIIAPEVDLLGSESNLVYIEESRRYRYAVAERLRDWMHDVCPAGDEASLQSDLLGYALGQVDWQEIADAWIETADEIKEGAQS